MLRFLKKFFSNPGTWVLFTLISIFVGIALPVAAPALVIAAIVMMGVSLFTLCLYVKNRFRKDRNKKDLLWDWLFKHPIQALIIGLGSLLFVVALTLTLGFFSLGFLQFFAWFSVIIASLAAMFLINNMRGGDGIFLAMVTIILPMLAFILISILTIAVASILAFFTGGALFAFMAPVFQMLATPFLTAAVTAGLGALPPLLLQIIGGFLFVLTSLSITNVLKRFAAWADDNMPSLKKGEPDIDKAIGNDKVVTNPTEAEKGTGLQQKPDPSFSSGPTKNQPNPVRTTDSNDPLENIDEEVVKKTGSLGLAQTSQ